MGNQMRPRKRAAIAMAIILVSTAAGACSPTTSLPHIGSLVATGISGTRQAGALATIVASTLIVPPTPTLTPEKPLAAATQGTPSPEENSACARGGTGTDIFDNAHDGYCLVYPVIFSVREVVPGTVEFLGPARNSSGEMVRASINIYQKELVNNRTLDEISLELWRDSKTPYRQHNILLGGLDALVADDLTGNEPWKYRQVFFLHNGYVYLMTFAPVDPNDIYQRAMTDIQLFWDLAIPSFRFYP